jgi:hypothetical protein
MSRLRPQSTRLVPRNCFTLLSRTVLSVVLSGKDLVLDDPNQLTYTIMDDQVDIVVKSESVVGDVITVLATLPVVGAGTSVIGSLCQSGNFIYFMNTLEHIFSVDVTNPAVPVAVGDVDLGAGIPRSLRCTGNVAYEVNSLNQLRIIDITVPAAPVVTSTTDLTTFAQPQPGPWSIGLDATDTSKIYVISNDAGGSFLCIYDVSNPLAVTQVGSIFFGGLSATDPSYLKVLQGLIHKLAFFVSNGQLFSVTVEDPTNMQVLSNNIVDTSGFTNLDGLGQRLMLTNTATQLLRVFNADQPASPVPMDAIHYQNQPLVPVMNINRVYVMERLI